MATITYEAKADKAPQTVEAASAQEAVKAFLATYPRTKKFQVSELRDGLFRTALTALLDPATRGPDDCFYQSFKSRAEAEAFVRQ